MAMDKVNAKIVQRDWALVGNLIKDNSELKEDIIPYITKGATKEDIKLGQQILKDYGYDIEMDKEYQPILKGLTPNIQVTYLF